MQAHIWVMLKGTVLDPQGKAIHQALNSLGTTSVRDVRQGKFFVLKIEGLDRAAAQQEVERIAREVLTNPVIEEFRFEILEDGAVAQASAGANPTSDKAGAPAAPAHSASDPRGKP